MQWLCFLKKILFIHYFLCLEFVFISFFLNFKDVRLKSVTFK